MVVPVKNNHKSQKSFETGGLPKSVAHDCEIEKILTK